MQVACFRYMFWFVLISFPYKWSLPDSSNSSLWSTLFFLFNIFHNLYNKCLLSYAFLLLFRKFHKYIISSLFFKKPHCSCSISGFINEIKRKWITTRISVWTSEIKIFFFGINKTFRPPCFSVACWSSVQSLSRVVHIYWKNTWAMQIITRRDIPIHIQQNANEKCLVRFGVQNDGNDVKKK